MAPRTIVGRPSIIAPNTLNREFTVDRPDRAWVTDITYIRTWQGWLYLAVVMDLLSRRIVGWSMKPTMARELVIDAVMMAVWRRKPNRTLIHTDQGSQYNLRQSTNLLGDPARCVHIGDRESDIYELFCTAQDAGTQFLLRTCVDLLAGNGEHTVATEMAEVECKEVHRVEVRERDVEMSEAVLELKFRRILVLPPLYKQRRYPALVLMVLHATERDKPRGRDRID